MKTLSFLLLWLPMVGIPQSIDTNRIIMEIDSLVGLSTELTDTRKFDEALSLGEQSLKRCEETLGKKHNKYAFCLFAIGRAYHLKSDYESAASFYEKSKEVRIHTVGASHDDYAKIITNLADVYFRKGEYEKAEKLHLEARSIHELNVGKQHISYSNSQTNLGVLYRYMGRYEDAEPCVKEALAIRKVLLGTEHPIYAQSLTNLAILFWAKNDFEKAEPLYLNSVQVFGRALGEEHPYYATSLMNLSLLYSRMGRLKEAEKALQKAIAIQQKTIGEEHPSYAVSLFNLGEVYYTQYRLTEAEGKFIQAKSILGKTKGKEHSQYAACLNVLANLNYEMGDLEKAETYFQEGKDIRENNLGKDHPEYAVSLSDMADFYYGTGSYNLSEKYHLQAIEIREKILGKQHDDYILSQTSLAILYNKMDFAEQAANLYYQAIESRKSQLSTAARFLSEQELFHYIHLLDQDLNRNYSFALTSIRKFKDNNFRANCYNHALFYKSLLLTASGQIKRIAGQNPEIQNKYKQLLSFRRRLSQEYSKPIEERQKVEQLEITANSLEKEMVKTVAGFDNLLKQVNWGELQENLKPNEAALEFIHFNYYAPDRTDSVMYAALLLRSGNAQPVFIPLCEQKEISLLFDLPNDRHSDYVNRLYNSTDQKKLYQLIWEPIEQHLQDVQTIYFAPSGILYRLNLNAIPINETKTLADKHQLIHLNSTRQLAISSKATSNNNKALLYGGIEFNLDTTAIASNNGTLSNTVATRTRGELDFENTDSTLRGGQWNFLKWTAVEANSLQFILERSDIEAEVVSGLDATEESFKKIGTVEPSPRILHLATHGFFFPDPESESVGGGESEPVFKTSDHPMIRSGLIMAGGNYAWKNGKPFKPNMEDGILTAYEISQMALSKTELVVLSACETGLGDIKGNEGVYGLQRAFKIAGAKNLIMSLWQVPDFQTQELMTTFYTEWLQEKKTIAEALRSAQKQMREKYKDPFFWAGFVLVE